MEYIKPISFLNVTKPFSILKPVLDENQNLVQNCYISNECELYNIDELNNHDYLNECSKANIKIRKDNHGRLYAPINNNSNCPKRTQHLARICRRAFDDPQKSEDFYRTHQVDHINPSIPVSNDISNLEWVTPQENMIRAAKTGVMLKTYDRKTIERICEMLIQKKSRKEIVETLGVNKNLIYDIKTGKSHKYISEKYVDLGFKYHKKSDRIQEEKEAEEICKLLVKNKNYTNTEIAKILNCDRRKVGSIRTGFCYRHISSKYGII